MTIIQTIESTLLAGEDLTVKKLGGITEILANQQALAVSPFYVDVLEAVIKDSSQGLVVPDGGVASLFNLGLEKNEDETFTRDAVLLLCDHAEYLSGCFDKLLTLAGTQSRKPYCRKYYLLAAFELSIRDSVKKFTFFSYLLSVDLSDSHEYLAAFAKILGLSYSLFNQEELFNKLTELCSTEVGNDDAYYEVGMCYMHKAWNANQRVDVLQYFGKSVSFFDEARCDDRPDAQLYYTIVKMLMEVAGEADLTKILTLRNDFEAALLSYTAYHSYNFRLAWVGARHTEMFSWVQLASKLAGLLEHRSKPAWYQPEMVIKEYLLSIYSCNRTIFSRNLVGGVEVLLKPLVNQTFADDESKLFLLDQWISENGIDENLPVAQQIKQEIEDYRALRKRGNEDGATGELLARVVPSIGGLPVPLLTNFNDWLKRYREQQTNNVSRVLQGVFNELCERLKIVSSYSDEVVRQNFETILYHTLRFLEVRMDSTRNNHQTAAYLFKGPTSPREGDLQEDYFNYMYAALLDSSVSTEKSDIAGGRVDVHFECVDHRFITEVKRESGDCSFESLRDKYVQQAAEYQNTSAKMGILLVLDLVEKPHGIGSLEGNVKLELVIKRDDPSQRAIVTVRVPGNRIVPSKM